MYTQSVYHNEYEMIVMQVFRVVHDDMDQLSMATLPSIKLRRLRECRQGHDSL